LRVVGDDFCEEAFSQSCSFRFVDGANAGAEEGVDCDRGDDSALEEGRGGWKEQKEKKGKRGTLL
jgi:hypothetical protein